MNPPKMPVHIGDLLRDTGHLRASGVGAYLLLMFHYWSTGGLPNDDDQLAAIARLSHSEWKKCRGTLQAFFKDGWKHGRIDFDLEKARGISEAASAAGKASGRSRSVKPPLNGRSLSVEPTLEPLNHVDRIGSAGASNFTQGSKKLSAAFWKALGFESALHVPPEFAGVDWRAVGWETAGWTVDLIDSETRRIGPDKPLTYYEKVFATAFAKRQAPLPIVEIREAEKLTVTHGTTKNQSGVVAAARRLAEQFENQSGDGIEGNPNAVLRVSQG